MLFGFKKFRQRNSLFRVGAKIQLLLEAPNIFACDELLHGESPILRGCESPLGHSIMG